MTVIMSPWRPLFDGVGGILHAAGMADEAFGLPGVQRDQRVQVVKIDLATPGLGFFTTPLDSTSKYQTRNATIFDFLAAYPQVKLAINASLAAADSPDVGANASLFGLAKSEGNLVCDPTVPAPQPTPTTEPDVRNDADTGTIALTITRDNQASFAIINAQSPTWLPPNSRLIEHSPWPGVYTAIAGSPNSYGWPPRPFVGGALKPGEAMTLHGGVNNGLVDYSFIAARTAVGLDAEARNLFLLTIDGIEGQPYGATFYDTGEWLKLAGATDGINLDGGGSTAIAVNIAGTSLLMNVPHGSEGPPYVQRANAQFFGVTLPD
jgi:hypothetical protein